VIFCPGTIQSRMASPETPATETETKTTGASRPQPAVRRGLEIGLGITALITAMILLWWTAQVLLVFFAALFLGVFFNGLARAMQKRSHFSYPFCLSFSLLALFMIFVIAGLIIGPAVSDQSAQLSDELPKAFNKLIGDVRGWPGGGKLIDALQQSFNSSQGNNVQSAIKFAGLTMHGLGGMLFAVVIGVFFACQPELYRNGFLALFPKSRRARLGEVLDELGFTLWWWLMGQLMTMASVGILIGIGLTLLGVPLSGTLGLLAALLSFIPSLGPFLSVIPAIMLGLTKGMGLAVCLLYLAVQTLEANVITPLVQRRAIDLPPAFVLASELLMGLLLGGAGLAFATPLAAVVLVLINMLYIQDYLKEPGNLPSRKRNGAKPVSA
jgi:predicted PurR-regulated permease PerM